MLRSVLSVVIVVVVIVVVFAVVDIVVVIETITTTVCCIYGFALGLAHNLIENNKNLKLIKHSKRKKKKKKPSSGISFTLSYHLCSQYLFGGQRGSDVARAQEKERIPKLLSYFSSD